MSKFPIPYRERQDFAEKYSEPLLALLQKYLQRRLPPEWSYEIKRDLEHGNGDMESLTLRVSTKTQEEYSNRMKIPFLIYEPNKIYVDIPSFSEIEREILDFIKKTSYDLVRLSSIESPELKQMQTKTKLQKLKMLALKAKTLKPVKNGEKSE